MNRLKSDKTSGSPANVWAYAAIEVMTGAIFLLLAVAGVLGLARSSMPVRDEVVLLIGLLIVLYVAAISLSRAYVRTKYRYMNGLQHSIDEQGVSIEENGQVIFLEWSRLNKGEYLPLVPAFRVWPTGHTRPLVFMVFGEGKLGTSKNSRDLSEKKLLKSGMSGRLKTRWFPW